VKKILVFTIPVGILLGIGVSFPFQAKAVSFGISHDDGSSNSLQKHLDALTVSGSKIDTIGGQSDADLFSNATNKYVASMLFGKAGLASTNKFGIYNPQGVKAQLFAGNNSNANRAFFSFNNGDLLVSITGSPATTDYLDFGNIFGFYLERADGVTFYSESDRNPNLSQQAVIYEGNDQTVLQIPGQGSQKFTTDQSIIAFDDLLRVGGSSDGDFQDLVVLVDSVQPTSVPEPNLLSALLVFGLGGMGLRLLKGKTRSHGC
jgi:hypothetical protein